MVRALARSRLHYAWVVLAVTFLVMLMAAGFRATPGVFLKPYENEFGWSPGLVGGGISISLLLYGAGAPFAAAIVERLGMRRVCSIALVVVAIASALTLVMDSPWQFYVLWGVLVGTATGAIAIPLAAIVANRWFVARRGLVVGVLTAGGATGQLLFLPALSVLIERVGWRSAAVTVGAVALAVVPLVLVFLRERPSDLGLLPYGATEAPAGPAAGAAPARAALGALAMAVRRPAFWLLAGGFAICGATTNGLVGTHFIPAAHDHGLPQTTAAGLLALIGVFDIAGTIASGWLTDRMDSRRLLGWYYALRGAALFALPMLITATPQARLLLFIVFYGLDWVATVPPTVALCREVFGDQGTLVFGWVFASHQIGAAIAATAAGALRTSLGSYDLAWYGAGVLCLVATCLSLALRRPAAPPRRPALAAA
jgi:MFS family permease